MTVRAVLTRALPHGAVLAALLLGCTDSGLIGEARGALACDPACDPGERCDAERGECTACGEGTLCEGPADAGACRGEDCECDDDDDCDDDDAPVCSDGRCAQCEEDDDCDGDGERECQDGRCVSVEDDGEGDGPADGSAGGDDEMSDDG